jgi:hypothetical protein
MREMHTKFLSEILNEGNHLEDIAIYGRILKK